MNAYFPSRLSASATLITIGVSLTFISLIFIANLNFGLPGAALTFVAFLIIFLALYARKPKGISVNGSSMTIEYPFHKKSIAFSAGQKIRQINQLPSMRFGSQGFFGYMGVSMDGTTCRASNLSQMVLIECIGSKLVVSCERPEELVLAARQSGRLAV